MKVFLIRHAKIETNDNVVQGTKDKIVIDDETREKVDLAKFKIPNPDKIYCSKLTRAKQTTSLIYPNRNDTIYTPLLNEYVRPSQYTGGDRNKLVKFWEIDHKEDKYDPEWKPEDGESYANCAIRAENFYKKLLKDKKDGIENVSVMAHGTLFRHLVCAITQVTEWKKNPRIVIDLLRKFSWDHLELKEFEI
jgi:broad specificity phosphatase PhoE